MKSFIFGLITVLTTLLHATVDASSFTEPHDHDGIVPPFAPGDPKIPLDKKALSTLSTGKPHQTQIESPTGGRGLVVQDVDAPTEIVWEKILDYDNYYKMVPKTIESKNYNVVDVKPTKNDPLSQIIYTRMKVGFPVLKLEFFIKHLYYPSLNSMTWTLDYTKKSDFNDSCGFWYVVPHPDDPDNQTRLFYSVEVSMFDWVPKFVVDFMSTKALTDATAWVKKYSELEFQKQGGKKEAVTVAVDASGAIESKKKGLSKMKFWSSKAEKLAKKEAEEAAQKKAEEERLAAIAEAKKDIFISWTRIGLASAVGLLALYNVHLGISH